jgi:endonuclease-8
LPEGHTIHRAAREQRRLLKGEAVRASSPQGRFAAGAALVDGAVLRDVEAYGKHLFYRFGDGHLVHVHLGLFGRFRLHRPPVPEPRGAVRLRLVGEPGGLDLLGPTACAVVDADERAAILRRLGPDPLRADADPEAFTRRVRRSPAPVGALLMDQAVIAGVGNVFRAEALWVCRIHPGRTGRDVSAEEAEALWTTVSGMLADGVRRGRIVTTANGRPWSRIPRGERTYVYGQATCLACGTAVQRFDLRGRMAYACPRCQPR